MPDRRLLLILLASCAPDEVPAPAPQVLSLRILPEEPSALDPIGAISSVDHADETELLWTIDGQLVGEGPVLEPGNHHHGDVVELSAVAVRGDARSEPLVAEVLIANSAPGAPEVSLNPQQPALGDSMSCTGVAEDPDEEELSYTYTWLADGLLWDGPGEDQVLDAAELSEAQTWRCDVVASDGELRSEVGSAEVDVQVCDGIEELTHPVYISFVMHNEEDDVGGVKGSNPQEPDYNDDPQVFDHFSAAVEELAAALRAEGAVLSFQTDWGFVEGVERYDPDFFTRLRSNAAVEIAPHAHESIVSYEELYDRLLLADADPRAYLGGVAFDRYTGMQQWFEARPDFSVWESATVDGGEGHDNDQPAPMLLHRAPWPDEVSEVPDLYVHREGGVLVTPAVASIAVGFGRIDPEQWLIQRPSGRFFTVVYLRYGLRGFLAAPGDAVPERWWATDPEQQANAQIEQAVEIARSMQPWIDSGEIVPLHLSELIELYERFEPCLDLSDGMDLSGYLPSRDG